MNDIGSLAVGTRIITIAGDLGIEHWGAPAARRGESGPQPIPQAGVSEQAAGFRLGLVRHQNSHLDRADPTFDDAHVAVGDLVLDVRFAEQVLDHRDERYVIRPEQLRHESTFP
jgi:hypothetical protein